MIWYVVESIRADNIFKFHVNMPLNGVLSFSPHALENCTLILRRHHCHWWAANVDLCSALMVIEVLWHGATLYNGHLRRTVTQPLLNVWQWSCQYMFLRLRSVATGDRSSISCKRVVRLTSTPPMLHLEW